jgi:hypothetical protein
MSRAERRLALSIAIGAALAVPVTTLRGPTHAAGFVAAAALMLDSRLVAPDGTPSFVRTVSRRMGGLVQCR